MEKLYKVLEMELHPALFPSLRSSRPMVGLLLLSFLSLKLTYITFYNYEKPINVNLPRKLEKKVLLKISQYSQENTCVCVSF